MTEENEKRILLICTAGITSGLLVKNIQTAADEQNIPIRVYSGSSNYRRTGHPKSTNRWSDDRSPIRIRSEPFEGFFELQSGELQDDQERRLRNVRWRGGA